MEELEKSRLGRLPTGYRSACWGGAYTAGLEETPARRDWTVVSLFLDTAVQS
jgi:hypothetical protein